VKKGLIITCGLLAVILIIGWQLNRESGNEHSDHHHDHDHEHHHDHEEENEVHLTSEQIDKAGIEVVEAKQGMLNLSLATRGRIIIHPDGLAHILPKISGVVKEARKNIGDKVKQGEIIAVLESREIAEIKANFLAVIEKEKLARSLFEREKNLREKKIASEEDYMNAKAAYEEAKINLKLARQQLYAIGLIEKDISNLLAQKDPELSHFVIRSPMDGVIMYRHLTKGEYVEDTSTIYEIADLKHVWVEIGVYPKDLNKVKVGQVVEVITPEEDSKRTATIIYVSPTIQEESITAKAIAEISNVDGMWRPGSYVKVNIDTESIPVSLIVPKTAVQEIEGVTYVFVKTPDGFEKRQVKVGKSDIEKVEIVEGLIAGEPYASTQTFLLKADLGKGEAEHEH
jgi:cobalt-zinc-cadmium efflux system membrane fusion protein